MEHIDAGEDNSENGNLQKNEQKTKQTSRAMQANSLLI